MAVRAKTGDVSHAAAERDAALLEPVDPPFSPFKLFVCTYQAMVAAPPLSMKTATRLFCAAVRDPAARGGPLLAVNSNFGHACQPGMEARLKALKPKPGARPRRVQGDGSCFNSTVELIYRATYAGAPPGKVYKVKWFPSTGETQVPGVVRADLSDGPAALAVFVADLARLDLAGAAAEDLARGAGALPAEVARAGEEARALGGGGASIASEEVRMLDYKFELERRGPRVLINLRALHALFGELKAADACLPSGGKGEPAPPAPLGARGKPRPLANLHGLVAVVPPLPIRWTDAPTDSIKTTVCFRHGRKGPRVNVFRKGKINILGATSAKSAEAIYGFFVELFRVNWRGLVCLTPRSDAEQSAPESPSEPTSLPRLEPASDPADAWDEATAEGLWVLLAELTELEAVPEASDAEPEGLHARGHKPQIPGSEVAVAHEGLA